MRRGHEVFERLRGKPNLAFCAAGLLSLAFASGALAHGNKPTRHFASAADAICTGYWTSYAAAYERNGEANANYSQQWAKQESRTNAGLVNHEYGKLHKLVPPAKESRRFKAFLKATHGQVALYNQMSAAASQGNASEYQAVESKWNKLYIQALTLAHEMNLPACALGPISKADATANQAVVTDLLERNDPSQCTQEMTLAAVKQAYGSLSSCQAQDQGAPGPNNATSVTFTSVFGSGAYGAVVFTASFPNGVTHRAEYLMYKQHGHWREMGFIPIS